MAAMPEVQRILKQVERALTDMLTHDQSGTVTVHCGGGEMVVEVAAKHRLKPVRVEPNQILELKR
jgi:DNA-binding protein YbaB